MEALGRVFCRSRVLDASVRLVGVFGSPDAGATLARQGFGRRWEDLRGRRLVRATFAGRWPDACRARHVGLFGGLDLRHAPEANCGSIAVIGSVLVVG